MARENQGIQICLIVFVILTLVLAITTFLFYHQYDEASTKAKAEADKARVADDAKRVGDGQIKTLIGLITTDQTITVDKVQEMFNADITAFGKSYAEEDRFYHPLVVTMQKAMADKNAELAAAKKENRDLDDKFKERERSKDAQMKTLEEERQKAVADRDNEVAKFKTERTRLTEYQAKLEGALKEMRKVDVSRVRELDDKVVDLQKRLKVLTDTIDRQAAIIANLTTPMIVGQPAGEIVEVDRASNTVWINLGRADSLAQQVSFSVFPADLSNMRLEGNKGSIEVTHVLGDHLAEARVTGDKLADPLLPGDKIYTPLWNPGQKRHFALAGFFDIDGSGQSALHTVINLIKTNGGVVDAYIEDADSRREGAGEMIVRVGNTMKRASELTDEEKGQPHGITPNTNYLILGTPPDDKAAPSQILAFTQMNKMVDHLRIPKMQFNDMLQAMGWKNAAPVVRYGHGTDFHAQPDPNRPANAVGGNSAFPPRQPSNSTTTPSGGGDRYYRY